MRTTLLLAALFSLTTTAFADTPTNGGEPPVEHDFTDADSIEGGRYTTEDRITQIRRTFGLQSLIRPRFTFVPELVKSVEDQ